MGKIKVTDCDIEGLHIIEPAVFPDERGYFMETYNQRDFEEAGLGMTFVQDNQSMSVKGVLRGLHFQKQYPQGKLVRVVRGKVFDVAVDLRKDSQTYGKWFGVELSAENKKQFEIPLYEKPFLSIEEASVYTGIGRDKLYELTNPEDCPFVLWIGNRRMIKRRVFDEYIEKCYSI